MKKKSHLISTVVTIILGVGIIFSLYLVGTKPLNETESVLLGLLLSTSSIMVSWLVTHIYSQISLEETIKLGAESNKENIKNYAVQAAEKVLNLSGELERLSELLSSAIEDSDEASNDKESVMLLQERISAANHNLRTLRSMNDTFLSDWRGVIGDEIDKQQSLEKHISLLAKELEEQKIERDTLKSQMVSPEDLNNIENRISETELRITQNFHELPFKVSASKEKAKKKYEIELTYVTSRGDWYLRSWKGNVQYSGGIASNIGVHFFDMLIWIFGNVERSDVHYVSSKKVRGYLVLERAHVKWFLSIDQEDIPKNFQEKKSF